MLLNSIRINLALSVPIFMTRFVSLGNNLIAMVLISKLGSEALSSSSIIMSIFSICFMILMAFNLAVLPLISDAYTNGNGGTIKSILQSSALINLLLSIPIFIGLIFIDKLLIFFHQPPLIALLVKKYFQGFLIGFVPMLWINLFEQFFIVIRQQQFIVYLSLFNFVLMPAFSYIFMFGKLHIPALGMFGAGIAASLTSVCSLCMMVIIISQIELFHQFRMFEKFEIKFIYLKKIFLLGLPVALQFAGEFLAYVCLTLMVGWLGLIALAAQQIVMQLTSVVSLLPSSVGQTVSSIIAEERNHLKRSKSVFAAFIIVCFGILIFTVLYFLFTYPIIHFYLLKNDSRTEMISMLAGQLLAVAMLSQFFESIKVILCSAYRGLSETKMPMLISLSGIWFVSLPLAYWIGFSLGYGVVGARIGFLGGLAFTTAALLLKWYKFFFKDHTPVSRQIDNRQGGTIF